MAKRFHRLYIRMNDEEWASFNAHHFAQSSGKTHAEFARQIILGEVSHPSLHSEISSHSIFQEFALALNESDKVQGPLPTLLHYLSAVVAGEILKQEADPVYRSAILGKRPAYDGMLRRMRGYEYDSKSKTKTPITPPK